MTPRADVLIITVNAHETQALQKVFKDANGHESPPIPLGDRYYHDLGSINGTKVFHAISEMGSATPGGALQTVEKGIRALNPTAVLSVGMAFGINEKKQKIGDVLISQQLLLYDLQRMGTQIILRGDKPHASTRLINFFDGFAQTSGKGNRATKALILSGEKLIDNVDYRDQLLAFAPEAIGGEMEGAGLYVACQDCGVDWIVIKAISDWADGQKARNKESRQKLAAMNAAQFVLQALQRAPLKKEQEPPRRPVSSQSDESNYVSRIAEKAVRLQRERAFIDPHPLSKDVSPNKLSSSASSTSRCSRHRQEFHTA